MFSLLERIIAAPELESGLSCGYFLDVEAGRGGAGATEESVAEKQ